MTAKKAVSRGDFHKRAARFATFFTDISRGGEGGEKLQKFALISRKIPRFIARFKPLGESVSGKVDSEKSGIARRFPQTSSEVCNVFHGHFSRR
ncbi:MAG: hypothetical protein ACI4JZ_05785 [Oscillospiraceae bacterium]